MKKTSKRRKGLGQALSELEAKDPAIAKAARDYEKMKTKLLSASGWYIVRNADSTEWGLHAKSADASHFHDTDGKPMGVVATLSAEVSFGLAGQVMTLLLTTLPKPKGPPYSLWENPQPISELDPELLAKLKLVKLTPEQIAEMKIQARERTKAFRPKR